MKREYNDDELVELVRTVRVARASPRGPGAARVWFMLAVIGPLVVLAYVVAMMVQSPMALVGLWPLLIGAVVVFAVAYPACVLSRRRFKKRVLARDGKVCPNCHYDLREVEEREGVMFCPECREPFRMSELARIWSGWSPGMVWWD